MTDTICIIEDLLHNRCITRGQLRGDRREAARACWTAMSEAERTVVKTQAKAASDPAHDVRWGVLDIIERSITESRI